MLGGDRDIWGHRVAAGHKRHRPPRAAPSTPLAQQHPSRLPWVRPAPHCLHQPAPRRQELLEGKVAPGPSGRELVACQHGLGALPPSNTFRCLGSCPTRVAMGTEGPQATPPPKGPQLGMSPGLVRAPTPPHTPAAVPGKAARLSHCPIPADDFPLAQLRLRHVPHQVNEGLPAILRLVSVHLLCRGKVLSVGSAPLPDPVPVCR